MAPGLKLCIPTTHGRPNVGKVLKDLSFPDSLQPVVLSEEGIEKPSKQIFMKALELINGDMRTKSTIQPEECLHIGDELIWFVLWLIEAVFISSCRTVIIMVRLQLVSMLCCFGGKDLMDTMSTKK